MGQAKEFSNGPGRSTDIPTQRVVSHPNLQAHEVSSSFQESVCQGTTLIHSIVVNHHHVHDFSPMHQNFQLMNRYPFWPNDQGNQSRCVHTSEPEMSNGLNHARMWLGQIILEENMKATAPVCISQPPSMDKLIVSVAPI